MFIHKLSSKPSQINNKNDTLYIIFINDDNKDILVQAIQNNQTLDNFNTIDVTDMESMFKYAESFDQPLDNFDTSNVTNMRWIFWGATSMFIGYIMRFAAKTIFVYNNYDAMDIEYNHFSNSSELDQYIRRHLHDIRHIKKNKHKIDSALDGFIVD